jgi:hypothetical protein
VCMLTTFEIRRQVSMRSTHAVCCMRDTVYYVQILDAELKGRT